MIKVKYDTKRIGAFNKSVTITSNAVTNPTQVIRIKGKTLAVDGTSTTPVKNQQEVHRLLNQTNKRFIQNNLRNLSR